MHGKLQINCSTFNERIACICTLDYASSLLQPQNTVKKEDEAVFLKFGVGAGGKWCLNFVTQYGRETFRYVENLDCTLTKFLGTKTVCFL